MAGVGIAGSAVLQSPCLAHLHAGVALAAELAHEELIELSIEDAVGDGLRQRAEEWRRGGAALSAGAVCRVGCRLALQTVGG